jgi:hypothetical protein
VQPIFMDESGDLGFGCGTAYFIVACIIPREGRKVNKVIKNFNAHLINNGWNPNVEIKASNVWHAPKNAEINSAYAYKNCPEVPIKHVINSLATLDLSINYVAIKLDTVSKAIKALPCAILYNLFSFELLMGPLCDFPAVELFADRRNKENHNMLKFDGFIESAVGIARAQKGKEPLNPLCIHHYHSKSADECTGQQRAMIEYGVRGLEAADFICWAIKKKYENNDDSWCAIIEKCIKRKKELYPTK